MDKGFEEAHLAVRKIILVLAVALILGITSVTVAILVAVTNISSVSTELLLRVFLFGVLPVTVQLTFLSIALENYLYKDGSQGGALTIAEKLIKLSVVEIIVGVLGLAVGNVWAYLGLSLIVVATIFYVVARAISKKFT